MSKAKPMDRMEWMYNYAERFTRLDDIRVCKLLELFQYSLLAIPFAWMACGFILLFLKPYAENPDAFTVGQLIFAVFVGILMIVLFAYYIPKLILVIPPLYPYKGSGYIPSMKGESRTAVGYAMGIFFFSNMKHLGTILTNLSDRLWSFSFKLKTA